MKQTTYIHGTDSDEQTRLALLNRLTNSAFVSFLGPGDQGRLLEVGSGLGILTTAIAQHLPNAKVVGVEFSAAQLTAATRVAPNVDLVRADAHALPLQSDGFDLVCCRYLLEHVSDPIRVLREMLRVLRPGGRLCVQENDIAVSHFDPDTVACDFVWRQFAVLQQRLGGDPFIGKRLSGLLQRAGFRDIALSLQPEIHHSGEPTFGPWIQNVIGNIEGAAAALQAHHLCTHEQIDDALGDYRRLMERADATALFYWNRASAVKYVLPSTCVALV